jgi:hypothetical protein
MILGKMKDDLDTLYSYDARLDYYQERIDENCQMVKDYEKTAETNHKEQKDNMHILMTKNNRERSDL